MSKKTGRKQSSPIGAPDHANVQNTAPAPVVTGHDARAEKRSGKGGGKKNSSDAPDGVTGNWS